MTDGVRLEPQAGPVVWLQGSPAGSPGGGGGAVANGPGVIFASLGFNGQLLLDIAEQTGGGASATVNLEGSFYKGFVDGLGNISSHPLGYTTLSAAPRVVARTAISVTASFSDSFLVQESYPWMRARISAIAGGAAVAVQLLPIPAGSLNHG